MKLIEFVSAVAILTAVIIGVFIQLDADFFLFFSSPASNFDGKVVWVTGASSGIGASVSCDLIKKGAKVVLSARREDALYRVAKACVGAYEPLVIPLDVTDLNAQQIAVDKILSVFGRIDSLLLNAGNLRLVILCADTDTCNRTQSANTRR
jgi:NADP-dependent 3-hydroxy acid dehydrogenase YdfG